MKYFISLFVCLLSLNVFSGTPDQDPLVSEIREQFQNAELVINEGDLQLGKRWVCSTFDAEFDSYDHSRQPVELGYFEAYADNIVKLKLGIDDEVEEKLFVFLDEYKLEHRYNGTSVGGKISSNDFQQIRKNSRGDLIIEVGFDKGRPKPYNNENNYIPSISHSGYKVMSYSMCLLSDII